MPEDPRLLFERDESDVLLELGDDDRFEVVEPADDFSEEDDVPVESVAPFEEDRDEGDFLEEPDVPVDLCGVRSRCDDLDSCAALCDAGACRAFSSCASSSARSFS